MRLDVRAHRAVTTLTAIVVVGTTWIGVSSTSATSNDPGRLAQTSTRPSTQPTTLASRLTPLWRALVSGDVLAARRLFFPRQAYLQMKRGVLTDPAADYAQRLVGFFTLDVGAYRRRLVTGGPPSLVRVSVAPGDATWIGPHACENLIGYWHLPGVRLVYRHGSRISSVAIDSLISWRGVWYVVHLGPNPRPANVGTVDGYSPGPGRPGPAGGC